MDTYIQIKFVESDERHNFLWLDLPELHFVWMYTAVLEKESVLHFSILKTLEHVLDICSREICSLHDCPSPNLNTPTSKTN